MCTNTTYLSWNGEADWLTDRFRTMKFEYSNNFIMVYITASFWHKSTPLLRVRALICAEVVAIGCILYQLIVSNDAVTLSLNDCVSSSGKLTGYDHNYFNLTN